jgi:hypothetical protein
VNSISLLSMSRDVLRACLSDADEKARLLTAQQNYSITQAYVVLCLRLLSKHEAVEGVLEMEEKARAKAVEATTR